MFIKHLLQAGQHKTRAVPSRSFHSSWARRAGHGEVITGQGKRAVVGVSAGCSGSHKVHSCFEGDTQAKIEKEGVYRRKISCTVARQCVKTWSVLGTTKSGDGSRAWVVSSLWLYNNHAHIIPNRWSSSQINLTAKACMPLFGPCVEKLHIKLRWKSLIENCSNDSQKYSVLCI